LASEDRPAWPAVETGFDRARATVNDNDERRFAFFIRIFLSRFKSEQIPERTIYSNPPVGDTRHNHCVGGQAECTGRAQDSHAAWCLECPWPTGIGSSWRSTSAPPMLTKVLPSQSGSSWSRTGSRSFASGWVIEGSDPLASRLRGRRGDRRQAGGHLSLRRYHVL